MTLLQHHVLALSLTAITTFVLGLVVFLAEPKKRLNQIFGLYSLTLVWWSGFEPFMISAHNPSTANFFAFMEWMGVVFIAPTFLHTVDIFTEKKGKVAKRILLLSYLLSGCFLILHLMGLIVKPPIPVGYVRFFTPVTKVGTLVPIVFLLLVNLGLWKLGRAYVTTTGQHRTHLKYLFWGSLLGYVGGSPDWLLNFQRHLPVLNPFGIYAVPCYSIATTYAVLHHKLFDVKVVIRKSLVYSLLITTLTVGYFGLVYGIERLFQTTLGYHSLWLSLSAFALTALLFQPLKFGIQRIVDWLFFRAPHEEVVKRMERLEEEVRHADKLKAISTLAAGMAHEIKNPLTAIKTFAEFLPEKGNDPAFQEKFQRIVTKEVDKIDRIVRELLQFARPASPQLESVPVSQVLDETLEVLSHECLARRIGIMRAYTPDDRVHADPQQLRQVFLNLCLNSLEAMDGHGGQLTVSTSRNTSHVSVAITDTGCGIPKEQLAHIFDPFFTTKSSGTGLGLSVVHGIIKEHRGRLKIASELNQGTTVKIELPAS